MGLLSYVRSRTQVSASRADGGAAAAASFMPPRPPRPGAGAPRPAGPRPPRPGTLPKKEESAEESSAKAARRDIGYEPYTKNLYSSNEPEKKQPPQRTRGSFGDGQPTVWPQKGDGDKRSPIDAI
jgi:hypothetical protein